MKRPLTLARLAVVAMALPVAIMALPGIARAEITFEGSLDGPTGGSDSPATGEATLVLNDDQTEVAFTITYSNLVGDEIAAHLHSAPPGTFGPIVFELPLGTPKNGVWDIPPQRVQSLLDGHIYVVIHSDAYPAGEIAGWMSAVEVPVDAAAWTEVRNLFHEETR